jgi:Homeodomain-like domain
MARSPFEIRLSLEERAELERRVACYTLPFKVVQRAKMILCVADGLTNAETARRLDTATDVVGRWRKRFSSSGWRVSMIGSARVARAVFPPEQIAEVKAIAGGLPRSQGVPLSRFSRAELHRLVVERGVCDASASTIARWLAEDAIKPWRYRSWIFPTDPDFEAKAGRVLDLDQGRFEGRLLHPGEFVICTDEKPRVQARRRTHQTLPPGPGSGQRVEHTYKRGGALTYLAAWDVRRGRLFGRSEAKGRDRAV